jgi:hypothetical protein
MARGILGVGVGMMRVMRVMANRVVRMRMDGHRHVREGLGVAVTVTRHVHAAAGGLVL